MADSLNKNSDGVARVTIFSEGNQVNTALFAPISVYIRKEVNRIGQATIVFNVGDISEDVIPESDDDSFSPGKKILINAGYDNDEKPVFEGVVASYNLVIAEGNESSIQIECCDNVYPSDVNAAAKLKVTYGIDLISFKGKLVDNDQFLRAELSHIQGQCKFTGNNKILPGNILKLDGLGKRFNGNAFVIAIEHEIKEGKWFTMAELGTPKPVITEKDTIITIDTPGKNKIVISDKDRSITIEDQNKNKIEMSPNGIFISSEKEITLRAKTDIIMDAGHSIKQTARANLEMKGLNIKANANVSLNVKGNANAEISSEGSTVVKGATVIIN